MPIKIMFEKFKRTFGFINQHALANKNLPLAYARFLWWQSQCNLNKNLIIKHFIGQTKFYAKKGLTGITGNIYTGLHEFEDMGFLLHFLQPQDTFVDIGANVGSYTLLASGYIGAKSITFEPAPNTFKVLTANIELNNIESRVTLHNKALGSYKSQLKFSTAHDTVNHIIADGEIDSTSVIVEVELLDNYFDNNISLLKIDVEGFETEVINGGKNLIESKNLKAIIIELNGSGGRYGYQEKKIHEYLLSANYQPYLYSPFKRSFRKLNSFGSHNTIYIKDLDFVLKRCKSSSFVKIMGTKF